MSYGIKSLRKFFSKQLGERKEMIAVGLYEGKLSEKMKKSKMLIMVEVVKDNWRKIQYRNLPFWIHHPYMLKAVRTMAKCVMDSKAGLNGKFFTG